MKHSAGCYRGFDDEIVTSWLSENEWAIGILYIIIGPLIALYGAKWFPYVTAGLIAVFTIGIILSISLAAGWMATTGGTVACFIVALVAGVIAGMLIRRHIWLMVALLGLIGGFFSGSLVFAFIGGLTGWADVWFYWTIAVAMAALGLMAACYLGKPVVIYGTALAGSYLFMRAWTLFFPGHYPSEAQLMEDPSSIEFDAIFWVFIAIFGVSFLTSACYQIKQDDAHDDLDGDFKSD